jgi:hypothetical protein
VFIVSEFVVLFMSRLGSDFWEPEQLAPAIVPETT